MERNLVFEGNVKCRSEARGIYFPRPHSGRRLELEKFTTQLTVTIHTTTASPSEETDRCHHGGNDDVYDKNSSKQLSCHAERHTRSVSAFAEMGRPKDESEGDMGSDKK